MDYFRNIVVVAALAGAIAGLGMTIAQQLTTVPLILKAEIYEGQGDAAPHDHGDAAAKRPAAHEHGDEEGWAPADGFERTVFTVARQYRHRHRLRAAAGRRQRAVRRHQGLAPGRVLGPRRLSPCSRLAPGLGFRPSFPPCRRPISARASSGGSATVLSHGARARAAVLSAVAACGRRRHRAAGRAASRSARRSRRATKSPIPEGLHHSFVVAVVLTTLLFWVLLGGLAGFSGIASSKRARPMAQS